jgi:hypothetical protein
MLVRKLHQEEFDLAADLPNSIIIDHHKRWNLDLLGVFPSVAEDNEGEAVVSDLQLWGEPVIELLGGVRDCVVVVVVAEGQADVRLLLLHRPTGD